MKKPFSALVIVSLALSAAAGDFKTDFSRGDIPGMTLNRRAGIEGGVLKVGNWGEAAFTLQAENPLQISFRVRCVKRHSGKQPSAWNVKLQGADHESGLFRFREDDCLESYFYKNNQRKGGLIKKIRNPEDGAWFQVSISIFRNSLSVKLNETELGNAKHPGFLPLLNLSFSSYNVEYEIDDLSVSALPQEKPVAIENPTFSLDFNDGTADAVTDKGMRIPPAEAAGIHFVPGIDGKGISLDPGTGSRLSYPLDGIFSSKIGGLMFWVRMNRKLGAQIFALTDGRESKMTVQQNGDRRTVIMVRRKDTEQQLGYIRTIPGAIGDWVLVALTWDEDSNAKYFINTLPYVVCFNPGQRMPDFINADLDQVKSLKFLSNPKASFTIDRLRFFHRTLTNSDVYDEYRRFMPFDMVMERTIVPADTPVSISVQIAPGGFYTRPMPVERDRFLTGKGTFEFILRGGRGNVLLQEKKEIAVDRPMDVSLGEVRLPTGNYTLECIVNHAYRRTFQVDSFTSSYKPDPANRELKTGKLIFSKKFNDPGDPSILKQGKLRLAENGQYLEAGSNKTDRFSIEIPFAEDQLGKPVALDIVWPDDKARMMGWYMYPGAFGVNRDRLQSGVSAGNELPNSGRMQTTRHIFYPGTSTYLFEARTMAPGMPAAVSEIRIYEIEGGLPALSIRRPGNLAPRNFGFYDEDQTFPNNLNADVLQRKSPAYGKFRSRYPNATVFIADQIMEYFDYTGMNTLHAPLWRYDVSYFPLEGQTAAGMFPGRGLAYVFDFFSRRNKRFVAMMNYANVPDIKQLEKIESDYRREGLESLDRYGDSITQYLMGDHRANICHPKVLKLFAGYFEEPVRRYAKSGLAGIEYWISSFGTWGSLEWGYDDYTVNKFSRETGIRVPEKIRDRYPFLTTEKRAQWLKWRSEQVTNLVKMVRGVLDRCNPELKLYLGINQDPDNYVKYGLDLEALKKIPNISFSVVRHPTAYRHGFHWGKPESTRNEELYDFHNRDIANYFVNGAAGVVISYNSYFETFVHPLDRKYQCYFENADIKPHGRYYLREAAFVVGAFDTLEYVAGGQPLATIGREAEAREFALAYGALPAEKFHPAGGIDDPAVARYLHTENGTYFYVVNMFHDNVKVSLDFDADLPFEDLSTGEKLRGGIIALKPFQLRSFLFPKRKIAVKNLRLAGTEKESATFYRRRIDRLKAAAALLADGGIDVAAERKDIAHLERMLAERRFAELYRVSFSRRMNQLLKKQSDLANLIRQQKQIDRGYYAVNCGSSEFYNAPDGRLFFPDQKFDGKYGYVGACSSITRDITGISGTDLPELYRTETYFLEGYKFKVPNGTYKIIFHLKAGFRPNFEPGTYSFSVSANGKAVLDRIDLYKLAGGDFHRALKLETGDVRVENGELTLLWKHNPSRRGQNASVCLANAIEILKQ